MIEVPLGVTRNCKHTHMYTAIVDRVDEWVREFNWSADISRTPRVYAVRRVMCMDGVKRKIYMHREIWERANGPIPSGQHIDHRIHGAHGGLDNRRSNLRLVDYTLNLANARLRANNTSGVRGVSWSKQRGKWEAYINFRRQKTPLGHYVSLKEAALAYDFAAAQIFGEYARLNFPTESNRGSVV